MKRHKYFWFLINLFAIWHRFPNGYSSCSQGLFNTAAIAHDFAYIFGFIYQVKDGKVVKYYLNRDEADRIFYDLCIVEGMSWLLAAFLYLGVRLLGAGRGIWARQIDYFNLDYKLFCNAIEEFYGRQQRQ